MKGFYFDHNIPREISFGTSCPIVAGEELGASPKDSKVWEFARENDLTIVTKDADFSIRISVSSPPPKVIHLRIGNLKRKAFLRLLSTMWPRIEATLKTHKLVNVYLDRVEGIH